MVRGDECAGEEGDGIDIELAGWEEDDGGADDKTCNGDLVNELGLFGGGGGERSGFLGRRGRHYEDVEGRS